eukprot:scaffold44925_cov23-Phaeocystis_antarctica.AAC.1
MNLSFKSCEVPAACGGRERVGGGLYHIGLQPPPHRVAASAKRGCSLYHIGLQPPPHRVAASAKWGCSLYHIGLQPLPHRVAGLPLEQLDALHDLILEP